ncbi:MAG: MucR family transcriptional regulator [Alphaproteobacteria bacterium]|jgi:predicted transcriptional regulator|nr:MucR family transcriptional regulator [Alphaproteobacteria bacterium]
MGNDNGERLSRDEMLRLVADVVSAYLSFNPLPATEIPDLIKTVHQSLNGLQSTVAQPQVNAAKPAVPVRRSIQDDFIVCLEDGKKLKMLKRYLRTKYGMTPDEYRAKWSLPSDYPMVAPNYSKQRSKFAKNIGLGRRRSTA